MVGLRLVDDVQQNQLRPEPAGQSERVGYCSEGFKTEVRGIEDSLEIGGLLGIRREAWSDG